MPPATANFSAARNTDETSAAIAKHRRDIRGDRAPARRGVQIFERTRVVVTHARQRQQGSGDKQRHGPASGRILA
jgi:hypothetical protein